MVIYADGNGRRKVCFEMRQTDVFFCSEHIILLGLRTLVLASICALVLSCLRLQW